MKTASVTEIASDFGVYLEAAKEGPVIVTRSGKPVAVLLGAANPADLERLLMGHSPELQAVLEGARKRFRAGKGIPHEAFWAEVEAEHAAPVKKDKRRQKNGRTSRPG